MFSNFYQLDLHKIKNSCCIRESRMQHRCKLYWKSNPPDELWISEVHVCRFLNQIHRSSQFYSLSGVEQSIKIWRCSPISLKHVSLWWLFFDSHIITQQSNTRVPLREKYPNNTCAYLLVRATSERFLLVGATFRTGWVSKSHWMQPVLLLTVHQWPSPVCVGGLFVVMI